MKYPFLRLSEVNAIYAHEMKQAACRIIDSGWYLNGEENRLFEKELAESCESQYAVALSNGLDALRLLFRAYIEMGKLKQGDEIIVQANTYIASILAITDNGLTPILVEPDEDTFNIDSSKIEKAITPATKGILIVHLYGTPCWNENIKEVITRHNLLVIEDNAQAIGAMADTQGINNSRMTGSIGHAAAFSFYPTKNIGALGDAGAITTSDHQLSQTVRALANYGSDKRYHNIYTGYNCRMDELQAAFLRIKLRHIEEENIHRRKIANIYDQHIDNPLIKKPAIIDGTGQVWHQYILRCDSRDRFREYLEANGIGSDIHYATPPHLQPCYMGRLGGPYPVTEALANTVVSIPIAAIDERDACQIATIINGYK